MQKKPSVSSSSSVKRDSTSKCEKKASTTTTVKKPTSSTKVTSSSKLPSKSTTSSQKKPEIAKTKPNQKLEEISQLLDYQANETATDIAKKEKVFADFLAWFEKNGGKVRGLDFPVAFGNSGYLGVAASENLPANTGIIAVPKNLVISTLEVIKDPKLGKIIKENPEFFDDEENEDGDFNKLALFLVTEQAKKGKSFWQPYLDVCANPVTLAQWDDKEIEQFQDPHLKKQQEEYLMELESTWQTFDTIAKKYPDVLPKGSYSRDTFIWAFEVCMTRCFGWTLPGSYLIPFADFLNHSKRGCVYYIVNNKFEEKSAPSGYKKKKRAMDLTIVDGINQTQSEVKEVQEQDNELLQFLGNYSSKLQNPVNISEAKFQEKEELLDNVRELNYDRLKTKEEEQIWNQVYFSTTEEEDNDSESDEESLTKNQEFYQMKLRENTEITQSFVMGETKEEQKTGNEIKTIAMNRIQSRETQKKERYLAELQDEEWDWYDSEDTANYLTFVTSRPQKKGQQIFNCYGRRSNRFLMLWYGFCFMDNAYDSVAFRLLQEWDTQPIELYNVFTEYITMNDWEFEQYKYDGTVYKTDCFTKEFKLKKSSICEELITFLRIKNLKTYKESDFFEIKITLPSSYKFEIEVLNQSLKFIEQLQKIKEKTPIEEDLSLLEKKNLPWKQRFAVIYRKEQKEIIRIQIRLFKLAISILDDMQKYCGKGGKTVKDSYMKFYPIDSELTEYEQKLYREKLRDYLRQVYIGIVTKQKSK